MDNPVARIDLENLKHNISIVKQQSSHSKVLAVIKANAYGHGALKVASALESDANVAAYGVSRLPEAELLFNSNITKPIVLLEGIIESEQLEVCSERGYITTIESRDQLELIKNTNLKKPLKIWLKFNTGMNRLGFNCHDSISVIDCIESLIRDKKLNSQYVVSTHFADAGDIESNYTELQLAKFKQIIKDSDLNNRANVELSAANSAGIFAWPDSHFDWVRPGISIYGASPLVNTSRESLGLKAVLELTTKIISIKLIKKGEYLGYNCMWQAPKDSLIAIIAFGYADGYPRAASNNAYVYINKQRCQVVGNNSMDMMAIDCSNLMNTNINIRDSVEIWGSNISIDEVARSHNRISYELFCQTTARVQREYQ